MQELEMGMKYNITACMMTTCISKNVNVLDI